MPARGREVFARSPLAHQAQRAAPYCGRQERESRQGGESDARASRLHRRRQDGRPAWRAVSSMPAIRLRSSTSTAAALAPLGGARRRGVRARRSRSPSAVETVFVSLPTPDIVRAVALGEGGVIAGKRIKTFVDLSTTGPRTCGAIAAALREEAASPRSRLAGERRDRRRRKRHARGHGRLPARALRAARAHPQDASAGSSISASGRAWARR